ncbi:MAG TPA: GNAT family N-acetyltransferase [Burkholderiaceae bacterium]|nr:GNAT family N-acetyltransferase [Burkholderiaceae bacterium]
MTEIVAYEQSFARGCADVLASVPEWFGRPATNAEYLRDLERYPSWIAIAGGVPIGAITLTEPLPRSFEVHFLVVARAWHSRGVGSELLRFVERVAVRQGGRWLHVKTLGPSDPDADYARTRMFYMKQGFAPLFESLTLWDYHTPALILVKTLAPATS